ncbi:MAG TPA: geranylgeranyl reductase family protein [Acidobacteriota bacterium]|nr:geranylgeranyl reductase family protein [Acidobacteriota bacterium]
MSATWDAVVVGAGPAGSAAAYFMSLQGHKVLLADRSRFPRDKSCGDACTPRSCSVLRKMGVLDRISRRGQRIERVRMISPRGRSITIPWASREFGDEGYVIPRRSLDRLLVERAEQAGACFRPATALRDVETHREGVSVRWKDGSSDRSRLLIGADGAYSLVRRSLFAQDYAESHSAWAIRGYYDQVPLEDAQALIVSWEEELLPGYAWVFPTGPGSVNVGLGMRTPWMRRKGRKLRQLYDSFLEGSSPLARMLGKGREAGRARGHYLPLGLHLPQIALPRVMLAGDAAGLINPFSGEGIEGALESGEMAAEAAAAWLQEGTFDERAALLYDRRVRRHFRRNYRICNALSHMIAYPVFVERILKLTDRRPASQRELIDLAFYGRGKLPWRTLLSIPFFK